MKAREIAAAIAAITVLTLGALGLEACGGDEDASNAPAPAECPDLRTTFKTDVLTGVLAPRCASCHSPTGLAKATRLLVTADETETLNRVRVLFREAGKSGPLLLAKVVGGEGHGGGQVLVESSREYQVLAQFGGMLDGNCAAAAQAQPANINRRFVRRLSTDEYESTVVDLVGLSGYGATLPSESRAEVFDNNAALMRTDTDYFQSVMDNARDIAQSPDLKWTTLGGCNTAGTACAKTFIETFGGRAFRRPVTADDVVRYNAVYAGIGGGDHEKGIRAVVRGMLQSPFFLFRTELGVKNGSRNDLTGYEIASELSYLFWGTMPDQGLFDAARDGKLQSKTEILVQAKRLLADPRAAASQGRFVDQWLNLRVLADKTKDPQKFPAFTTEVQTELRKETLSFFTETTRATDGTLKTLLTADFSYLSEGAARYYGVPWSGAAAGGLKRVAQPGRSGILTQASLLALGATSTDPVAILRGKLVRSRLLCQPIGDPPASAAVVTAMLAPPRNNRERAAQLLGNPDCAGCHHKMDPIGLVYEGFDAAGKASGVSDVSGEVLDAPSAAGPVNGPLELHTKLAESAEVQACFTKLWARYGYAIADSAEASEVVAKLAGDFAAQDTGLASLILSLTQTDHFTSRLGDPEETAAPAATPPAPPARGDAGADAGKGGVADVPTTPGVTFQAQAGYENGGKEEGAGNWWLRGTLLNTTTAPITNWSYRMPRPGDFAESSKVTVGAAGQFWIVRAGADNQTLMPNQGTYIEVRFTK